MKDELIELADKHFPKGVSKERGQAMVLVAEALNLFEQYAAKARLDEWDWINVNTPYDDMTLFQARANKRIKELNQERGKNG